MADTIVFIHGNFVTRRTWEPWVARYSARGYQVVSIAYPGRDKPVKTLKANPTDPFLRTLDITTTIEHHVQSIRALGEKPIIIGHSFGGLLTQLMVQRDLAAAAVVIDSVAPPGVLSLKWSFFRGTWPVLNPFAGSRPYYMSFKHYQYAFANDQTLAEQRAGYDLDIVPESRRLARGGLFPAAKVDFKRAHAPLLFIAGERDHLMPAALNHTNYERYKRKSSSLVEFKEFPGRGHYSIIGGEGWQEVADYALAWAQRVTGTVDVAPPGTQATDKASRNAASERATSRMGR
jgi:pimeloyl-ACP methyl ester carboxylesterase